MSLNIFLIIKYKSQSNKELFNICVYFLRYKKFHTKKSMETNNNIHLLLLFQDTGVQSQVELYQRLNKMVLDGALLNT